MGLKKKSMLFLVDEELRLLSYKVNNSALFSINSSDMGRYFLDVIADLEINKFKENILNLFIREDGCRFFGNYKGTVLDIEMVTIPMSAGKIGVIIISDSSCLENDQYGFSCKDIIDIIESHEDVFWVASNDLKDFKYISPTYNKLYYLDSENIYKNPEIFLDSICEEDRHLFLNAVRNKKWDVSYRLKRKDGGCLLVKNKGNISNSGLLCGIISRKVEHHYDFSNEVLKSYRYDDVFENDVVGILIANRHGVILEVNSCFCKWLQYDKSLLINKHFSFITHPEDVESDVGLFKEIVSGSKNGFSLEKRYVKKDGDVFYGLLNVSKLNNVCNEVDDGFVIAFVKDVNDQVRSRDEIYNRINFDALTGLPNRNLLNDRLAQVISHASRIKSAVYILFVDVDGLQEINDSQGHMAGDYIIKVMGERLLSSVRKTDTVARFGGDEFVIVLNDAIDFDGAETVLLKLLENCRVPIYIDNIEYRLTSSIGISTYPNDAVTPELLIQYADTAMYEAKKGGGDSFVFFSNDMNEKAKRRVEIKADIIKSLDDNQFFMLFQPIVNSLTGKIEKAEALIRWRKDSDSFISPADFIPIAEESSLIEAIDLWVFESVANMVRDKQLELEYVSINVTSRTIFNPTFFPILEHYIDVSDRICFELTERVMHLNSEELICAIKKIRGLGYKVSVDDFGTGYSSLSRIQDYPVDIIKIDKSFTDRVDFSEGEYPIIEAIFNIAEAIDVNVVVEGVETKEQVQYFSKKQRVSIQGYFFYKPLTEFELMEQLAYQNVH